MEEFMKNTFLTLFLASFMVLPLYAMHSSGPQYHAIHEIHPDKTIHFSHLGHFKTASDAVYLLTQAAKEGKIPEDFKQIQEVKILEKEIKSAKFATEQLLLVICKNGNSYILKEIKHDKEPLEEIKRLERARTSQRLHPYVYPNKKDLQCIFPNSYLSYHHAGKKHILVIMPKAKGISMQSIMEKFKHNAHDENLIHIACKAYYDLGAAMAKFYKQFGSLDATVGHHDFHHGNIFYDEKSGLVTLIDNERIANTLETPSDISNDLGHLFITSPFIIEWSNGGFMHDFNWKRWYKMVLPSFIMGFIRTYPSNERKEVFNKLVTFIYKWNSKVKESDSREIRGIIKELVENLKTQFISENKTELHCASSNPDLTTLVEILLAEKTTAFNMPDVFGNMPLHEAAYFGCRKSVELLLQKGSTINAKNNKGETPLFKAQYQQHSNIVDILRRHGAH